MEDQYDKVHMKTTGKPCLEPNGLHAGRWTEEEHQNFLIGLKEYGREWKKVAEKIKTRTSAQIRSHAQKYFAKLAKEQGEAPSMVEHSSPHADANYEARGPSVYDSPSLGPKQPKMNFPLKFDDEAFAGGMGEPLYTARVVRGSDGRRTSMLVKMEPSSKRGASAGGGRLSEVERREATLEMMENRKKTILSELEQLERGGKSEVALQMWSRLRDELARLNVEIGRLQESMSLLQSKGASAYKREYATPSKGSRKVHPVSPKDGKLPPLAAIVTGKRFSRDTSDSEDEYSSSSSELLGALSPHKRQKVAGLGDDELVAIQVLSSYRAAELRSPPTSSRRHGLGSPMSISMVTSSAMRPSAVF